MKQVIVMAAGMGTRMGEITKTIHKALIPINGEPILERNIKFMIEAGIKRIILILGYKSEQFENLIKKYQQKIEIIVIYNNKYKEYNNIMSIYYALPYFNMDSYITCADLYLVNNIYKKYQSDHNFYLHRIVKDLKKPEWVAKLDENNCITSVDKNGYSGSIYSGFSYWTIHDLEYIKKLLLEKDLHNENVKKMYWDDLLLPVFKKFKVYVKHYTDEDVIEIDDQTDLKYLLNFVKKEN